MGDADNGAGRLILKVTVEVADNQHATIYVHEGEEAHDLAIQFCLDHDLPDSLVEPLTSHILENLRHVQPELEKAELPRKPSLRQDCWYCGNSVPNDAQFCRRCGNRRAPANGAGGANAAASAPQSVRSRSNESTPKRFGTLSQRAGGGGASADSPRFVQLFQDSVHRKFRMQRLKQQVEKDEEQRLRTSVKVAPGTVRYTAWRPDGQAALGERLYNDAAKRALKLRHLQEVREELRRQQEEQEATFKPAIEVSQRRWQGTARSMADPEGLKKRMKMDRLRHMQEKAELNGCTFKPEIDQKSDEMISQRIARLKITGTLYDSLYEDALKRRERLFKSLQALPPGVTFHPDIGTERCDGETREDFVNRLAYSKSYSDRLTCRRQLGRGWVSLQRKKQETERQSKELGGQPEFHPRTGRGPLVERNKEGLPIGDFLYEHGRRGKAAASSQVPEQPSMPKVGANSQQLFEETKQRTYRQLFDWLTSIDPQGQLKAETMCLEGLDADLCAFLQPMASFLHSSGQQLEFAAFCAALDYQRQHAVEPTAHLFTQRSAKIGKVAKCEPPVPKIDQNSARLAMKRRSRSVPLHEQLYRESDIRDARMEERRILAGEAELQECTFHPKLRSRSASQRSAGSPARSSPQSGRRQDSPGLLPSPSPSPREGFAAPDGSDSLRGSQGSCAPRTPRGPGVPGGPGMDRTWQERVGREDKVSLHTPPGPYMPAPSPGSRGAEQEAVA
ncbi:unnamed protein product [Effrenium voratum]|nr:unnamed protein product [Effrenium voratum]